MQPPGLLRGLLVLLLVAAILFAFNQARLVARDTATKRLIASRLVADRVQAEAAARLLAELRLLVARPDVRNALTAGDVAAAGALARAGGLGDDATVQVVGVGETLRVATSGPFNPGSLWEAMRGALEHGEEVGIEQDEQGEDLAVVAAVRESTVDGATTAVAIARPLDEALLEAVEGATGLEANLYGADEGRRAAGLGDDEGGQRQEDEATSGLWRRWERRRRPFVTASVSRAVAVDPIRDRHGTVIGIRELTIPLAYGDAVRDLPTNRRFLTELLFLGLAALMAALLARGARRG